MAQVVVWWIMLLLEWDVLCSVFVVLYCLSKNIITCFLMGRIRDARFLIVLCLTLVCSLGCKAIVIDAPNGIFQDLIDTIRELKNEVNYLRREITIIRQQILYP